MWIHPSFLERLKSSSRRKRGSFGDVALIGMGGLFVDSETRESASHPGKTYAFARGQGIATGFELARLSDEGIP
jgi:hypothetical protein